MDILETLSATVPGEQITPDEIAFGDKIIIVMPHAIRRGIVSSLSRTADDIEIKTHGVGGDRVETTCLRRRDSEEWSIHRIGNVGALPTPFYRLALLKPVSAVIGAKTDVGGPLWTAPSVIGHRLVSFLHSNITITEPVLREEILGGRFATLEFQDDTKRFVHSPRHWRVLD